MKLYSSTLNLYELIENVREFDDHIKRFLDTASYWKDKLTILKRFSSEKSWENFENYSKVKANFCSSQPLNLNLDCKNLVDKIL